MGPAGIEPATYQVKQITSAHFTMRFQLSLPNRACTFQCIRLSRSHLQTSCVPSPCIGHYLDHLSTMDTPSPCVSRRLGDPQVPLHITSVRRFPVRPFAFSSIAM